MLPCFVFFYEPYGYDHIVYELFRSHFGSSMFVIELLLVLLFGVVVKVFFTVLEALLEIALD